MFKKSVSKTEKNKQSYLYIADFLADFAKEVPKAVAFCAEPALFEKICAAVETRGIRFLGLDFTAPKEELPSPADYETALEQAKTEHTLCLVNILPPQESADALKLAKLTDGIVLSQEYGKSRYSDFEHCLSVLKWNKVSILGVVGIK